MNGGAYTHIGMGGCVRGMYHTHAHMCASFHCLLFDHVPIHHTCRLCITQLMSGPPAKRVRTDDEISSNPVEDGATHTEAWSRPLVPPACLMEDLPVSPELSEQIANWRAGVAAIVEGQDDRLVVIVGPCSIHGV